MSMMVSFCAVLFPRGVLDEILNLIESVSGDFPSYSQSCVLLNKLGCVAQSVGHLTRKSEVLGSISGLATYLRFSFR